MVNKEAVAAWVAALRSGNYQQTRHVLFEAVGTETVDFEVAYCCLGVACEVAMEHGVPIRRVGHSGYEYREEECGFCTAGEGCSWCTHLTGSDLPPPVREWFGFRDSDVELEMDGDYTNAMHLNDTLHFDFERIANVVAANYLDGGEEDQSEPGSPATVG